MERVRRIKGRDSHKPFIVLISDLKMLDLLSISEEQAEPLRRYWPGALSVIFPAAQAPAWLQRGTRSLAIRIPDHPKLLALIDKVGPLVSTSANIQGEPPVHSAQEAQGLFGDTIDFYVDAGPLYSEPSTLAATDGHQLRVIRQGTVKIR